MLLRQRDVSGQRASAAIREIVHSAARSDMRVAAPCSGARDAKQLSML